MQGVAPEIGGGSLGALTTTENTKNGSDAIKIGNTEGQKLPRRQFTDKKKEDLRNNSCFKCQKFRCRTWKYGKDTVVSNAVQTKSNVNESNGYYYTSSRFEAKESIL